MARQFSSKGWTADKLPDLSGKTYVITGANSGIGFEAARMLGERGAQITMLCRSEKKATDAVRELTGLAPEGRFDFVQMDLADLSSVRRAADDIRKTHQSIDGLVNNAGIMMVPKRELTVDGFETQFGVNHLGHFALNARLCELVEAASGRFVAVASIAHKYARGFKFDDLMMEQGYTATGAYCQSKLANLSYALELNRRLEAGGLKARAFACHPGYSATNLQSTGPGAIAALVMKPLNAILAQSAEKGALPTVLCTAGTEAKPGEYYGPTGFRDFGGPVDVASSTRAARDEKAASRLWAKSEELTSASWPIFESTA